jgi:hypothetical protein
MNQTSRHALPLIASGQAQKEVTHNEALQIVDRRLQLSVASRSLPQPPDPAVTGMMFIVPAQATGAWSDQAGRVASFDGYGWTFDTPQDGWLAWIADERIFAIFDSAWTSGVWPVASLRIGAREVLAAPPATVSPAEGGTVVDVQNRQVVTQLIAALRAQGLIQ